MDSAPSASSNSPSITHLRSCPSPRSPTISSDESYILPNNGLGLLLPGYRIDDRRVSATRIYSRCHGKDSDRGPVSVNRRSGTEDRGVSQSRAERRTDGVSGL